MKLNNIKISVRLGMLGAMYLIAMLVISLNGWRSLDEANSDASAALAKVQALAMAADTARSA